MKALASQLLRLAAMWLLCLVCLQAFFVLRIASMAAVHPSSTSFQRSEAWRLLTTRHRLEWSWTWVDAARIHTKLQRAVIASEDAGFVDHSGVEWDAIEKAWDQNQRAQVRAQARALAAKPGSARATLPPKVVGGSTISQQLAKNLFFSSERTVVRKAQELVVTLMLETLLGKERILEIYLNHVEWGEGVFGAEAAARHYFHKPAAQLGTMEAARLAVMLPAPKRFEKNPTSGYVQSRSATIAERMGGVELP